jgi:hypothetical protein
MTTKRSGKKQTRFDESRGEMRLLMAASAVFVLLLGLTFLVVQIAVLKEKNAYLLMFPFSAFFLVGITLLVASAFLNIKAAAVLLDFLFGVLRKKT